MSRMNKKATESMDLRFKEIHQNIKTVCDGLRSLEKTGLKTELLVLMLQDSTGLNKTQCQAVIEALPKLEKFYLKQEQQL